MATIKCFQDLVAWQRGMDLVAALYQVTKRFPSDERFGLRAQIRRAGVSIPSNVAEGYGRRRRDDYVRFLDIARGSANEIQTQLLIALRLDFISAEQMQPAMELVLQEQRILKGLVLGLENSDKKDVKS